jgi:hypothetical protein
MSCSASHEAQASAVSSIRPRTSSGAVGSTASRRSTGAQRSEKPMRSPSRTEKDARIVESSTSTGTPARTAMRLGPPKVRPPSSSARKSGRTSPYSGRGASSMTRSTSPHTPSTLRNTSCGASKPRSCPRCPGAKAIASIRRTLPPSVVNVVSITSVPGR